MLSDFLVFFLQDSYPQQKLNLKGIQITRGLTMYVCMYVFRRSRIDQTVRMYFKLLLEGERGRGLVVCAVGT